MVGHPLNLFLLSSPVFLPTVLECEFITLCDIKREGLEKREDKTTIKNVTTIPLVPI